MRVTDGHGGARGRGTAWSMEEAALMMRQQAGGVWTGERSRVDRASGSGSPTAVLVLAISI